jgi:predicted MFS family arabinose efflux permease
MRGEDNDVIVTFAAFRVRSFRFQWPADLLTSWAFEMESVILGWYVMVHTGSVLLLTVFASLQFLGTLAAPMFGVLGDRLSGRLMLCAMRATYTALAVLLMVPALGGFLTPAWVFVVAALAGIVRPNDLVMRTSLIGETIPPPHLMGALGMSRATGDSARIAGALAGAGLSSLLGIGWTYVFVTVCYAVGLALTLGVSRQPPVSVPGAPARVAGGVSVGARQPSQWHHLKEGLVLILKTPALLAMMWLAFLINLTAYPVSSGLLPYVARQIYHLDAAGLGWLVASFGLGGLLASIGMAATGGSRHPERATLVCTALWYALLLGFGHLRSASAGFAVLLVTGFLQNVAMISMSAVILAEAGDGFRARVMGVRTLAVYGLPLGLLGAGLLIEHIGYPLTITATAAMSVIITSLIGIRWRASMWHPARHPSAATSIPQRA